MTCSYRGEDRSYMLIPYRSVLAFYAEDLRYFGNTHAKHKRCACGCGAPVFDREKWASSACKKRIQRVLNVRQLRNPTDMQKGRLQVIDFVNAKPGQNSVMA